MDNKKMREDLKRYMHAFRRSRKAFTYEKLDAFVRGLQAYRNYVKPIKKSRAVKSYQLKQLNKYFYAELKKYEGGNTES